MYPFVRLAIEVAQNRKAQDMSICDVHVSTHTCWPWDLDPWRELNNGRTLTLYDLGRIPLSMRTGLAAALEANGWGMTIAGSAVRYRRRIRAFEKVTMLTRCIGWDARFFYFDQSMWRGGDACGQVLIRSAVTSVNGIVPPAQVVAAMGHSTAAPALPDWVQAWIAAEAARPWPPEAGALLPDGRG